MLQELEVVFDGTALQLETPLNLAIGTRLRIIVERVLSNEPESQPFSQIESESAKETLYLLSIPGMRESIQEGLAASIDQCSQELEW